MQSMGVVGYVSLTATLQLPLPVSQKQSSECLPPSQYSRFILA